jgi:cytochrome c-type biogenesis protein CcmF
VGGSLGAWSLAASPLAALATTAVAVRVATTETPTNVQRRVVRWGPIVTASLLATATVALSWALATSDGSLVYVADNSRRGSSLPYRIAGLWGGLEGSLLLFTALLALVAALGASRPDRLGSADGAHRGWAVAIAVASAVVAGFALTALLIAEPFARLAIPAIDGGGLTPILEHPAMLVHPPLLYLGAVLTLVPFARTVAASCTGALDARWRADTRRWLLAAWTVLAAALAIGANWAYVELGWGGYWAWDPIENTGLLPWLGITAFLHATQRSMRRAAPGRTGLVALAVVPFALAMLGALLTRSGLAESVHAFGEAAAVGRALGAVLVGVLVAASVAVLVAARTRMTSAETSGHEPDTPDLRTMSAPSIAGVSVANLLLVQVALMVAAILVIGVGTVADPVAGAIGSTRRAIGGAYYARLLAPVAVVLVLLALSISVAAVAWRARGRGRQAGTIGAHVAHLGILVLAIGVAGSTVGDASSAGLDPGESLDVGAYRATLVRSEVRDHARGTGIVALVRVTRGGALVAELVPELNAYPDRGIVLAESALSSTPATDVQVAVRNASDDGTLLVEVRVRPLAMFVWWGAAILVLGGVLQLVARRARRVVAAAPT